MSEDSAGTGTGAPAALRVRVLGGLRVDGITDSELGSRKARTLVKALALAGGRAVSIDRLSDILWPEQLPAKPADQIGVLASRLRRVLGADRLVRSDAGLTLTVDWLDLAELANLVATAVEAFAAGRMVAARVAAAAALDLASGTVLPDEEGEWVDTPRARAAALTGRAREIAGETAFDSGDLAGATLLAEDALRVDPYDERALRLLMRTQASAGRPAVALAAYARVRALLGEELGVSPDPETEDLHGQILRGEVARHVADADQQRQVIGRAAEVAMLHRHRRAVGAGGAQVIVIGGEAGIGKTTLAAAFAADAAREGDRVLVARVDELGRDLPLQPILDTVRDGVAATQRIDATAVPDTGSARAALFDAVLDAVAPVGGRTVLVVDDLHWADATTRAWLTWVAGRSRPLLVVALARPPTSVPGAVAMPLGGLDDDAIDMLVRSVAGDSARAAAIRARSDGNPLFAVALAEAADGELPHSVQDAVRTTIETLDGAAGECTRVAAVLDAADEIELLGAVLGCSVADVIDRLERARLAGLLIERDDGFAFRHVLVREALAQTVGAARTALLHREAAQALDARAGSDPLAVAIHARKGGALDIAAAAFRRAASVSFERTDLDAAEEQLRASLHARESQRSRVDLARVLMVRQRLHDAADEAERAIALDGTADAFEIAGWIEYYRRRYDRARLLADEAIARADAVADSAVISSARALAGRIRHAAGEVAEAEVHLLEALRGPAAVRRVAEVWLGQLRVHQGRPNEALAVVDHALLDSTRIAHPFAPLHGRFARIHALGQMGRVADGLRECATFRRGIERAGDIGTRFVATELNIRSWLLRGVGRIDEAAELTLRAIEINGSPDGAGPSSDGFAEAYWVAWLDLADGRLLGGDVRGADAALHALAAIDAWQGTMAWHQRHRRGLVRARLARLAGDLDRAAAFAMEVQVDAAQRGSGRYAALAHAELALSGGDGDTRRIGATLAALGACAALELPGVAAGLGRLFGNDAWCALATRATATLQAQMSAIDVEQHGAQS